MEKIFINAENTSFGRLAGYVAKKILGGDKVYVLNCEKAIISGNKRDIISDYNHKLSLGGSALKGPNYTKQEEKIVKRSIRGMIPDYRLGRGKEAIKRVKCFKGIPEEYKNEKIMTLDINLPKKYITIKQLISSL